MISSWRRMVADFGSSTTLRRCGQFNKTNTRHLLFKPQTALRVRANVNTDTPLPPDEPAGENPPDGAMIDYFLANDAVVR